MTEVSASGCHHALLDIVFTTHLLSLEGQFVRTGEDLRNVRKSSLVQLNRMSTTVVNRVVLFPNTSTALAGSGAWKSLLIRFDTLSCDSVALLIWLAPCLLLASCVRSVKLEPCLPQAQSIVTRNDVTSILLMNLCILILENSSWASGQGQALDGAGGGP